MITTDALARNLAKYFMDAYNREHAVNHLLTEINSLRDESKQSLQFHTKAALVQLIEINMAKDARCLNAFQLLKPTLLRKLQEPVRINQRKIERMPSVPI